MEFDNIDNMSALRLKIVIKTSTVPAFARKAAVRLYKLGKKDFAFNFLIQQMNQYKLSSTHNNIIRETCPKAAMELGKLGDERAIEPLFEALGGLGFGPAYGLAQLNSTSVESRLAKLAEDESKEAVYAAVALGYMKNDKIVSRLIYLLEHHKDYENAVNDRWIFSLRSEILITLGAYTGNFSAENSFKKNVRDKDIDWILNRYIHQDEYPSQRWLEWEIVMKFGWKDYVDTDERLFAFRHAHIDRWKQYSDTACPFKTMEDVEKLRHLVIENIMMKFNSTVTVNQDN